MTEILSKRAPDRRRLERLRSQAHPPTTVRCAITESGALIAQDGIEALALADETGTPITIEIVGDVVSDRSVRGCAIAYCPEVKSYVRSTATPRDKMLQIRCSATEMIRIARMARDAGLTISAFVRGRILGA